MWKKLRLGAESIEEFERHYRQRVLVDVQEEDVVSYIPEGEAWNKLSHLGFPSAP